MWPIGTAEINQNRTDANRLLPGTAILYAASWTADGEGGSVQSFTASATVDARLGPLSGSETEIASRLGVVNQFALSIPAATSLPLTSRVEYNAATYEVTQVTDRTPWELIRRVMVTEIR